MSDVQPINFAPEDMTDLYTLYKSDPEFVKVLKQNANNEFLKNNGGGGSETTTVDWADITGKPATFTPTIGNTGTTAKAGNWVPAWSDVTGKPAVIAAGADAAAARSAIGAGTSNLVIGTTSTTAKAGNYVPTWTEVTGKPTTFTPPAATEAAIGGVKMAATQADSAATDIETLVSDFNSLLAKLKAAGIMA